MAVPDIESMDSMVLRVRELLERARAIKGTDSIEPALPVSEFTGDLGLPESSKSKPAHHSVVEVAARRLFHEFVASTNIQDPGFVQIWNLFDILSICGDQDQCEAGLVWWLIEELLDSQSIEDCRKVFDYLESRRERLIAKNFAKEHLVILRSCNELLRRLSRAEDTVFCGRVFIFLFQSFPLGDRSSVNPRGEYHTENVTVFEDRTHHEHVEGDAMQIDRDPPQAADQGVGGGQPAADDVKVTISKAEDGAPGKAPTVGTEELYPIFWTLQKAFSNPPRIFSQEFFDEFKLGLESTIARFRQEPKLIHAHPVESKRGIKRKADDADDQFASNFNPKYLTSRDLFKLELSDLAFQRHILGQALILIDFLLSLTVDSKGKLAHLTTQRALQYNYTLSDSDKEWALATKAAIAAYLQDGPDGQFYYRMVDTVLSRDKHWVRWKLENCPEIARPAVPFDDLQDAKSGAQRACGSKRLKAFPNGSLDLSYLSDEQSVSGLDRLKKRERYTLPGVETFIKGVCAAELNLEFGVSEEEAAQLQESKAGNTWRALRMAAKAKLSAFNKIDDTGRSLDDAVTGKPEQSDGAEQRDEGSTHEAPNDGDGGSAPEGAGQQ